VPELRCPHCKKPVKDGVVEDGVARHRSCGDKQRKIKVAMSITRAAADTFERLGAGNVSAGAGIAATVAEHVGDDVVRKVVEG
jgi:hypothetical protein